MIYSSVPAYIIHSFVHLLGFVVIWRFPKTGVPKIIKIRPLKSILGRMSVISWEEWVWFLGGPYFPKLSKQPHAKCLVNMVQHLTLVFQKERTHFTQKLPIVIKTFNRKFLQDHEEDEEQPTEAGHWSPLVLSACKCVESNSDLCWHSWPSLSFSITSMNANKDLIFPWKMSCLRLLMKHFSLQAPTLQAILDEGFNAAPDTAVMALDWTDWTENQLGFKLSWWNSLLFVRENPGQTAIAHIVLVLKLVLWYCCGQSCT